MNSLSLADCTRLLALVAETPAAEVRQKIEQMLADQGIAPGEQVDRALAPEVAEFVHALLAVAARREDDSHATEQLKERMDMLSSASFEGLLVHEDGVVIDVNARLGELLRADPRDLLGPETIRTAVAAEDLSGVLQRVASGYEGAYVITGIRRDGSRFRAELQSKQGRLGRRPVRIAAVRDVTERERTLELLRESEQRFKDLTETAFDLCVASRDGIVVELRGSLERFLGYEPSEVLGRPVVDFVAPSARPVTVQALEGKMEGAYFSTLLSKQGEAVPVEVIGVNSSLDGVPTRMAGVRDLRLIRRIEAERWQLQHQVERMQRLDSLGLLAGGIAHDFNNLLVGVIGNAELLLHSTLGPDARELLGGILSAGQRATDLTRRLLAYSGRGEIAPPRALDVGELVSDLDSLVSSARAKGIVIATSIEPGAAVLGDRTTLLQVLLNLSTNALDALESSRGRVEIRARRVSKPDPRFDDAIGATVRPGSWVLLEVEDDGVGMDEVTKSRIFEPFFSTKERGHGLGLAACLGILRGHGAALHVESAPGQGSCFSLLLPAAEPVDRKATRPEPSDVQPCRVLVVDDHPMVRAQMRRSLELRGFTVFDAEDGQSCLEQLEQRTFDLILLDMTMPGLSGPELLRAIRRRGLTVPVVLSSGYTLSAEALDAGSFQAFLQKPYGIGELLEAIELARRAPP